VRTRILPAAVLFAALVAAAAPASAQSRGFVRIGGGIQAGSDSLSDAGTFTANAETATISATQSFDGGPIVQVAAGGRIGRLFAVGVEVSRFSKRGDATVSAAIPHPFFFGQLRPVTGTAQLDREELAVHVQLGTVIDPSPRVQVTLFVGPTFFRVTQQTVAGVNYADAYPFDTATFSSAQLHENKVSAVGFNMGADLAFFFTNQIGVGVSGQFTNGAAKLDGLGGAQLEPVLGGGQVGAGLRLRF